MEQTMESFSFQADPSSPLKESDGTVAARFSDKMEADFVVQQ